MMSDIKYTRYAHAEGHTAGCYTKDGNYIVTCGTDCDIRMWTCNGDDYEPKSITLREPATHIIFRNDLIYVGSGNYVEVYNYPTLKFSERPLRFSAPVSHIDVSEDNTLLVAASCDMLIKIKDLKTNEIKELSGHTAPVLWVSLNQELDYLVSSSCDGSVVVWDISTGKSVKCIDNIIPKCNDFFSAVSLGCPTWTKSSNKNLVVASDNRINVYSTNDWIFLSDLKCPNIKNSIAVILFSTCGKFLCGGSVVGEIAMWNFKNHELVYYFESPYPNKVSIRSLSCHPQRLDVAFCDRLGRLCVVSPKVNKTIKDPSAVADPAVRRVQTGDMLEKLDNEGSEVGSEDNENTISINQIKASTGFLSESEGDDNETNGAEGSEFDYPSKTVVNTHLQECFQPSSTPSHFQHGYMVWNSVGVVRSFNSESESSIDVEFHDTMLHHSIHRRNSQDYFIAALSSKVLCLASQCLLTGVLLNAWDDKKEWSVDMPPNENIVAVATSSNWLCCATNCNQLRFYTSTGIQRQIVSLPGPVVCINSHERFLLVITHISIGLPDCQNLGYMIFEILDFFIKALTPCQPLPLSPKTKLKWCGFTDEGTPCTYDGSGILRLSRDFLLWEVVCDTRAHCKNPSDNYFVLGISERLQNVRSILCKGGWYPMTTLRPAVVELPLRIPLCPSEGKKTNLEDIFWRHIFSLPALERLSRENSEYMAEMNNWDKLLKQTVLRMFAEAYSNKLDMRAVNIASLMSEQPLEMAIKLVQGGGRMYLVEKLSNVNPKDWNDLRQDTRNLETETSYSAIYTNVRSIRNDLNSRQILHKSLQGDMFEDSQRSPTRACQLTSDKDKEESLDVESQMPCSRINTCINPFKVQKKEEHGPKGLSFFNNIQQSTLKPTKSDGTLQNKMSKIKALDISKEKSSNPSTKRIKFVDWFKGQKESLQTRFPDLNPNELTKVAMKIFRDEISQRSQSQKKTEEAEEKTENSFDEVLPETKKRKIESDKSKIKTSTSEKLSTFGFSK